MASAPDLDVDALWEHARQLLFEWSDRATPALQAMRVAVPITLEDGTLIIGIDPRIHHLASHLQVPTQRNEIRRALKEVSGMDLDFRVIEGTELADWERLKTPPAPPDLPRLETERVAESAWEELSMRMHREYKDFKGKQQPLARVDFLFRMLEDIAQVADRAERQEPTAKGFQRHLTQALERLSGMTDLPPTAVALEYVRRFGELH